MYTHFNLILCDSRSLIVTYTYRMCSEMNDGEEQNNTKDRISTIFTVYTAKRAAGMRNLNK